MNANCNLSPLLFLGCLVAVAAHPGTTLVADLVYAKDGSGVYGYKDTPKLPWCQWMVHDPDRPAAKRIDPGTAGAAAPGSFGTDMFFFFEDGFSRSTSVTW